MRRLGQGTGNLELGAGGDADVVVAPEGRDNQFASGVLGRKADEEGHAVGVVH